jgi:hypothetical protein
MRPTAQLLPASAATTVEPYDGLVQEIKTAQAIDTMCAEVKTRIFGTLIVDIPDLPRIEELEEDQSNKWEVTTGVRTYNGRIYVRKDDLLCNKVVIVFYDNPESVHF